MDVTKNLSQYLRDHGISMAHVQRETGLPYEVLRSSLSPTNRGRLLKADEFLKICLAIDKNPLDFASEEHE